jgi:transcriptional regulator with GAF, ATPase, and Fis domain
MSTSENADWLARVDAAERRGQAALGHKALALERLLAISREIATLAPETTLARILEGVLELSGTLRAALLLVEPDGSLRCERVAPGLPPAAEFEYSHSVVRQALDSGQVVVVEDARRSVYRRRTSVVQLGLHALLVIPLRTQRATLGALYLDTDADAGPGALRLDTEVLAAFGAQAAIALENARLYRRLEDELHLLQRTLEQSARFDQLLYASAAMERVCRAIRQVLDTDVSVLIEGETGTGKELVARALHFNGPRKAARFLAQNAGALPDTLLESELFGHRRGAFSGAVEHKLGLFEAAQGGTLFLDEIGEASPALQVRLLRLLETRSLRRVGETQDRPVDVRVVAATHRSLADEVRAGRFRADLYYRLSVFPIVVPPLRERPEDVPVLVRHFVEQANATLGRAVQKVPAEVMAELAARPWPGNVRELANVVQRLVLLSPGNTLAAPQAPGMEARATSATAVASGIAPLVEVEREHLRRALAASGGNLSQAARLLGLKRGTLRWRLRKAGLAS